MGALSHTEGEAINHQIDDYLMVMGKQYFNHKFFMLGSSPNFWKAFYIVELGRIFCEDNCHLEKNECLEGTLKTLLR